MSDSWWDKLGSARSNLEKVAEDIIREKNVILNFSATAPWVAQFRMLLHSKLSEDLICKDIEKLTFNDGSVNNYMLENYCRKELRFRYRPPKSVGTFLGECQSMTLGDKVIWIRLEQQNKFEEWLDFILDYQKADNHENRKAVFIIEPAVPLDNIVQNRYFNQYDIGFEIPEYAKYTYASILAADIGIKDSLFNYLAQLVTSCCDDVELIPICIKKYRAFLQNPYATILEIMDTYLRSDDTEFYYSLNIEEFNNRIWEAQLKTLFPAVESYRVYILHKLMKQINEKLQFPYKTNFGDLESPMEMELKDLTYAIGTGRLVMNDSKEYNRLDRFRKFRNSLAHGTPLSYDDVKFLVENYKG